MLLEKESSPVVNGGGISYAKSTLWLERDRIHVDWKTHAIPAFLTQENETVSYWPLFVNNNLQKDFCKKMLHPVSVSAKVCGTNESSGQRQTKEMKP